MISLFVGLISLSVVTRFLPPSGFGKLGILMAFSILLTTLYDMGIMQGTFRRTFGQGDDADDGGDAGDDDDDLSDSPDQAYDTRRALGAGLVLCTLVATLGTVTVAALSPEIAHLLTGDSGDDGLVVLAALLASVGALWRLVWNVVRLERRPVTYVSLGAMRPVLMAAGSIAFLAGGGGIGGALAGNASGAGVAVLITLAVGRSSYHPNFDLRAIGQTFKIARRWIPMIIAFWVIHHGDVILLSRYVSDHDVGLYQLAVRIGGTLSFYVGAVLTAWNPLRRTPMFVAARRASGMEIGASLVFYYWLVSAWLIVALSAGAEVLVRLGPSSYADAAPLIPLAAGGIVAYGGYMTMYRGTRYRNRSQWHVGLTVWAGLVFVASALVLIPAFGAYGAALASIIGFLAAMLTTAVQSQRGRTPLPLDYVRLLGAGTLAAVCVVLAVVVGPLAGPAEPAVRVGAVLLYPLGVVLLGIVPRDQWARMAGLLRQVFSSQTAADDTLRRRLAALPRADRTTLELVVAEGDLRTTAADLDAQERVTFAGRVGGIMCEVAGVERAGDAAPDIAQYLFARDPVAQHDLLARQMMKEQVIEPVDLATLERTAESLRRLPPAEWRDLEPAAAVLADPTELEEQGLEGVSVEALPADGSGAPPDGGTGVSDSVGDGAGPCYADAALAALGPSSRPESEATDARHPVPPEPPEGWVVAPPDFIGIGAGRAGTTRWFDLIVAHPQVRAPISTRKELHFFERFADGSATPEALAEYQRYFPRPPGELTGEWSGYMRDWWTPRLIRRAAPQAKLLVSLRDPVERYLSEWARARRRRSQGPELRPIALSDMANRGLYFQQLRRILRFFDPEQILVLQYEACVEDPERELRRTYEFLGLEYVDPGPDALSAHPNLGRNRLEFDLPEALRPDLLAFFSADVRSLVRRFPEVDLRLWPNFNR